jgi:hypothetical protein
MMRRARVRVVRGVWRRGMEAWSCERGFRGRRERRRIGRMERKARIWWAEVNDLDCGELGQRKFVVDADIAT